MLLSETNYPFRVVGGKGPPSFLWTPSPHGIHRGIWNRTNGPANVRLDLEGANPLRYNRLRAQWARRKAQQFDTPWKGSGPRGGPSPSAVGGSEEGGAQRSIAPDAHCFTWNIPPAARGYAPREAGPMVTRDSSCPVIGIFTVRSEMPSPSGGDGPNSEDEPGPFSATTSPRGARNGAEIAHT